MRTIAVRGHLARRNASKEIRLLDEDGCSARESRECLLRACSGWVRRVGLRWSCLGGALPDVGCGGSRQGDEVVLSHGVEAVLEWKVQLDDPRVLLSVSSVRMEDFSSA